MRWAWVGLCLLFSVGCSKTLHSMAVTPRYFATGELKPARAFKPCTGLQVKVVDERDNPRLGVRFHEDTPSEQVPLVAEGDTEAYLESGFQEALQRAGVLPGTNAAVLNADLVRLSLEESIAFNAVYTAQMIFDFTLQLPGQSKSCWTGRVVGSGKNYGKKASGLNYQETLNRALEDAVGKLLDADGFSEALCGTCAPDSQPEPPANPPAPTEDAQ